MAQQEEEQNETKQNTSAVQSTLQVQFTTKIADVSLQCDETVYALTSKLKSSDLCQVVNHILNRKSDTDRLDFDFLIDGRYVVGGQSLAEHLSENEISSEETLTIEYIEKTIEPSAKRSDEHPDWVSCVDALKPGLFITGCYDGIVRCWKPSNDADNNNNGGGGGVGGGDALWCQHRGNIAPIKGITALYATNTEHGHARNMYYFATVAKDRAVKVFGLHESEKRIEQVAKIDTHTKQASHRLAIDCCSAPYPSKVFATGSADHTIKIYRLRQTGIGHGMDEDAAVDGDGADDVASSEPPTKKRKLQSVQQFMDGDADAADDDDDAAVGASEEKASAASAAAGVTLSNLCTLRGHTDAVKCVDWSNACALYSGSWDNCMKLWDIDKEIDSYTWSTQSGVTCLKYWSSQNVLISAHSNQKIAIWDPRTDRNVSSKTQSDMTFRSHSLPITGLDVDGMAGMDDDAADSASQVRNNAFLFISCAHDGKLKIWDIRCQTPLYNIEKHEGKALCVGWYGNTIVSGGSDCKLHSFKWNK